MSRLLIVANRLPVTVRPTPGGVVVERSTGGLATGMSRPHEQSAGLWIGWSGAGDDLTPAQQAELETQLASQRLVGVPLNRDLVTRYYEGYSNGVLWPLFHYLLDQVPLQPSDWDAYVQANEQFAEVVVAQYRPGDLIWIHDYQLLLLPGLVRRRLPEARIGFFLHIPFPSEELFRTLPARRQLLEGFLGADLVGFHTPTYLRHFATALTDILGLTVDIDRVQLPGREVRLGVFPMGVDASLFQSLSREPAVEAEAEALRGDGSVRILVGVDRLDYTKGIPRRLLSFERMLQTHPELREKVRLVQVAVPSRTGVEAYQDFRSLVDGLVGRINGAFGTPSWVPVHYIFRGLSAEDLVALYRAADVMLVTPLRDGMNLVAKEFVASRTDGDGVLVLSEFAGAAWELPEALQVNPYDTDATAEVIFRALTMEPEERRARLRPAPRAGGDLRRAPLGVVLPRAARAGDGPRGPGTVAHRRRGRPARRAHDVAREQRRAAAPPRLRRDPGAVHGDPGAGAARRRAHPPAPLARRAAPTPKCTSSAAGAARRWSSGSAACRSGSTRSTVSGPVLPARRSGPRPPTSMPPGGSRCSASCATSPPARPGRSSR